MIRKDIKTVEVFPRKCKKCRRISEKMALLALTASFALLTPISTKADAVSPAVTTIEDQNTIAIFGDSYSTWNEAGDDNHAYYYPFYSVVRGGDVTSKDKLWTEILARNTLSKIVYVSAFNGATLSRDSLDDTSSIVSRIETSPENVADTIIIMGGINDVWEHKDVGSTDVKDAGASKCGFFASALRRSISVLKKKNPDADIIYSLVIDDDSLIESVPYESAARRICSDESVTYAPLSDIECLESHPDATGMIQIAEKLKTAMYKGLS